MNRLGRNCIVVVIVAVDSINYTGSCTGMHDTGESKFEVAECRIGGINAVMVSPAEHNFIAVLQPYRRSGAADSTENIFPLKSGFTRSDIPQVKYKFAHRSFRPLLRFDSPSKLIE